MAIYLDNAATTRISETVSKEIARAERDLFYNSAALYAPSLSVKNEIKRANEIIKNRISRTADAELVFTSGATEGNNMVIFGKITNSRNHLIVLAGEHSSVFAPSMHLKKQGYEVDFISLKRDGTANLDAVKRLVKPNTALLVFGMVNSDTGCLQPAADIIRTARAVNKDIHIHCDAVQAFCKFDFDATALGLNSCVVSSHKINGPKGIGALWVKKGASLRQMMHGGSQQNLRPGTENNAAILGFAKAVETFNTDENFTRMKNLSSRLLQGLPNGCLLNSVYLPEKKELVNPYIVNIQLPGVLGQTVMNALSDVGICVGMGSACASTASKSRTLLAMGIPEAKTKQVLRVSVGVYNTAEDIDRFLENLNNILQNLLKA